MSDSVKDGKEEISTEPTKTFFVDMFTRDIPLEQAILDLVDNSVDGAKRLADAKAEKPFEGRTVTIIFNADKFEINDNCGGFGTEVAVKYAFRFGRHPDAKTTAHSIGQFGVGMKRALFKFGRRFEVKSATTDEEWAIDIDVDWWEDQPGWTFPWAKFKDARAVSKANPGTEILVYNLRPEVSAKFKTKNFETLIISLIKSKHRQFISDGLQIKVNGSAIDATSLTVISDSLVKPGVDFLEFDEDGNLAGDGDTVSVKVKIVAGLGPSLPREAGWYVICNGRVILEADRRASTGWGLIEEAASRTVIPTFHNQFARFRGLVWFDSDDSSKVPWNTTKTDVDQDSPVWRQTFEHMMTMMRPVIDFLNELDTDIDENTKAKSPLHEVVAKSATRAPEAFTIKASFQAPTREAVKKGPRYLKIQYSKLEDEVEFLQQELSLGSGKAVGERTFEIVLNRLRGE